MKSKNVAKAKDDIEDNIVQKNSSYWRKHNNSRQKDKKTKKYKLIREIEMKLDMEHTNGGS